LRAPTLLNIAWIPILGWDGKFHSLEAVTFAPLTNPANMNGNETKLIAALEAIAGYRAAFAHAFPDGVISRPHIEQAIATFERTIVSSPAPFDRWVAGDENAVSAAAKRGFTIFTGKGRCAECHSGWNFTDGAFYDVGDAKDDDIGRGRIFPSSQKLQHAFKTPTLRDVARRAPYTHDGSVATLADIIDLYDRGGLDRPSRSELIGPLHLSAEEKTDLIAFLDTLTSDSAPFSVPELPR
jgi:cytochrome c peroxidase